MSSKSVAEKLLIRPNTTLWSSHPERLQLLGRLPEGLLLASVPASATTVILFADDSASLRALLRENEQVLRQPNVLWVAYPKGNRTDINRDTLWPMVAEYGLRPISQVSVDDVWSALRFRALKAGEEQFSGGKPGSAASG